MKVNNHFNKLILSKWRLIQVVIQLTPTSATDHSIAVYAIKT